MGFFMKAILGRLDEMERFQFEAAKNAFNRGYLPVSQDRDAARERFAISAIAMQRMSASSQRDHRKFIRDPAVVDYLKFNEAFVDAIRSNEGFSKFEWNDLVELDGKLKQSQVDTKMGATPTQALTKMLAKADVASSDDLSTALFALALFAMRAALASGEITKLASGQIVATMRENLFQAAATATIANFDAIHSLINRNPPTGKFHQMYLDALSTSETLDPWKVSYQPRRKALEQEAKAAVEAKRRRDAEVAKARNDLDELNAQFRLTDAGYISLTPTQSDGFFDRQKLTEAVRNLAAVLSRAKGFVYYGNDTATIVGAVRDIQTMDWRMIAVCKSLLLRDRAGEFNNEYHREHRTVFLDTQLRFVRAINADGRTELAFRSGTSYGSDKITAQVAREHMHLYTGNLSKLWLEVQTHHEKRKTASPGEAAVAAFVLASPR